MKTKAAYILSISLYVLLSLGGLLFIETPPSYQKTKNSVKDTELQSPTLSQSDIILGFENLTRSFQTVANSYKIEKQFSVSLTEKFQLSSVKVGFKTISRLNDTRYPFFQLFIAYRKLLI